MLHEKLQHLAEDDIKNVTELYKDSTVKVKDIVKKYKIDILPSKLINILPPVATEKKCRHCGEFMYTKLQARTASKHNTENELICKKCGHIESKHQTGGVNKCECANCTKEQEEIYKNKAHIIKKCYGGNREKIQPQDLVYYDLLVLKLLINSNTENTINIIKPLNTCDKEIIELTRGLVVRNILRVSVNSDVNAFCEEDFPLTYFLDKVEYVVNVDFGDYVSIDDYLDEHEDIYIEERINTLKDYIYDDIIWNLKSMTREVGLYFEETSKGKEKIMKLLDKISYSQIMYLAKSVIKNSLYYVSIGKTNKNIVAKSIMKTIYKYYDNAINNDWVICNEDYDYYVSNKLKSYIKDILKKDLRILDSVISKECLMSSDTV